MSILKKFVPLGVKVLVAHLLGLCRGVAREGPRGSGPWTQPFWD